MIEGWARFMLEGFDVEVESAGTSQENASQGEVTDKSVIAMQAYKIDISGHKSRYAGDLDLSKFDLFLTTGGDINQSLLELRVPPEKIITVGAKNGIPNPWQKNQAAYHDCAQAIADWFSLEGGTRKVLEKLFPID